MIRRIRPPRAAARGAPNRIDEGALRLTGLPPVSRPPGAAILIQIVALQENTNGNHIKM
jgi:hypothetical protein